MRSVRVLNRACSDEVLLAQLLPQSRHLLLAPVGAVAALDTHGSSRMNFVLAREIACQLSADDLLDLNGAVLLDLRIAGSSTVL